MGSRPMPAAAVLFAKASEVKLLGMSRGDMVPISVLALATSPFGPRRPTAEGIGLGLTSDRGPTEAPTEVPLVERRQILRDAGTS